MKIKINKTVLIAFISVLIMFAGQTVHISDVNAYNEVNAVNYTRYERIKACANAFEEKKENIIYTSTYDITNYIISCALRMHGVYVQESGA